MFNVLWLFGVATIRTLASRLRSGPLQPSWSFGFETTVEFLRSDWGGRWQGSVPEFRDELNTRYYPSKAVPKVTIESFKIAGCDAYWFTPPDVTAGKVLLYLHGGSYMYCSAKTAHANLIAQLALGIGYKVAAIDYRLAPEHPYPAALEDALAAFEYLVESGYSPDNIVIAGDSAGGNLTLVTQLALRDKGVPQAKASVLISPWLDLKSESDSFNRNRAYDYGTREMLVYQAKLFAGSADVADPKLSPLNASFEGLAPVQIVYGTAELLHDECARFVKLARQAGVPVTETVLKEMPHNGPVFADFHPEGKRGVDEITAYIKEKLES